MRVSHKERAHRRAFGAQRADVALIIRHELRKRNVTLTMLAQQLGCSKQNISSVIYGTRHSPRVLDALLAIGIDPALLFDPRRTLSQQQAS